MAITTWADIEQLIAANPNFSIDALAQQQGLTPSVNDEGRTVYRNAEGNLVKIDPSNNDQYNASTVYRNQLWNQGMLPLVDQFSGINPDAPFQWNDGRQTTNFNSFREALDSSYGGGQAGTFTTDQYGTPVYKTASGAMAGGLQWNPKDTMFQDWLMMMAAAMGGGALATGALGAGVGTGALSSGLTEGAVLASEGGFVPGAFELGASSYGGSAAAGLDAAAAQAAAAGAGTGAATTAFPSGSAFDPSNIYQSIGEQIPTPNVSTGTNFPAQAGTELGQLAPNLTTGISGNPIAPVNPLYESMIPGANGGFPQTPGTPNLPSTQTPPSTGIPDVPPDDIGKTPTPSVDDIPTTGTTPTLPLGDSWDKVMSWLEKNWGTLAGSVLGAVGANNSANTYRDMQNQYLALGAPSRARLEASYAPGFTMNNEPGYKDALDQATNAYTRMASAGRLSGVSAGNPIANPSAWNETLKNVSANLALPALQNYRSGNAASGQLGVAPSASFGAGSANATGGAYNAVGYGLGALSAPADPYQDAIRRLLGQQNQGVLRQT